MDNNKILEDFNSYYKAIVDADNSQHLTDVNGSINEDMNNIANLLPGTTIAMLSMGNLEHFSKSLDEIVNIGKKHGLDTNRLELVLSAIRLAYHQRNENTSAISAEIDRLKKLEDSFNKNIKNTIKEVKLALYLSGDETIGKTSYKYEETTGPVGNVFLSEKDIENFDKNAVYRSVREDNKRNNNSTSALNYNVEVVEKTDNIFASLTNMRKAQVQREKYEKDLKSLNEGRNIADTLNFEAINKKKHVSEVKTDEFTSVSKLLEDNVTEFERITSGLNTYADIMSLEMSKLNSLSISMDNFKKSFDKDAKKINSYIKNNPDSVKTYNLITDLVHARKAISITSDALDDVISIKEGTIDFVEDDLALAKNSLDEYENNFLLRAKADVLRYRYVLGEATDKELENYNNSVAKEFQVRLRAQEKRDKESIANGNNMIVDVYRRNLSAANNTLTAYESEFNALKSEHGRLKSIRDGLENGRLTNYMSYVIHEKGSILVGSNLYKNMNSSEIELFQDMLRNSVSIPEEIDDSIANDLVSEAQEEPVAKPTEKAPEPESEPEPAPKIELSPAPMNPSKIESMKDVKLSEIMSDFVNFMANKGTSFSGDFSDVTLGSSKEEFADSMFIYNDEYQGAQLVLDQAIADGKSADEIKMLEDNLKSVEAKVRKDLEEFWTYAVEKGKEITANPASTPLDAEINPEESKAKEAPKTKESKLKRIKPKIIGKLPAAAKVLAVAVGIAALGVIIAPIITGGTLQVAAAGYIAGKIIEKSNGKSK